MTDHQHGPDLDAALSRFEDLLLALPYDRALPDLRVLLQRAGLPPESLRRDDRVLKVLHEAVLARPFADPDDVVATRSEVELLTLEVEILTERLADPATDGDDLAAAEARLATIRGRLRELLDQL